MIAPSWLSYRKSITIDPVDPVIWVLFFSTRIFGWIHYGFNGLNRLDGFVLICDLSFVINRGRNPADPVDPVISVLFFSRGFQDYRIRRIGLITDYTE